MCVCGGGGGGAGGYFYVVIFSNSELFTKSFSCQTNRIWKNIFIDNIFNANISYSILKVNLCTSRCTQLQQKLEMSVSFVILRQFCLISKMFCRCQHFCSHDATFTGHLG